MALTIQERKKKLFITGATGVALAAVVTVLINVLGNWLSYRLDMTSQGAYSLSPASRKLVKNLEDPVVIKAYFTPDLPPPYNLYERYTHDLLTEYRAASRGRVRFEFPLPNPASEFEKKASEAGLAPIQFEQVGSDQFQVRRGYMGMVLYHRDKTESIPIIKNIQQLEYDLTTRIAKMASRTRKTIAVTGAHGEIDWIDGKSKLAADLTELYDFKQINLPISTKPITADALLVIGPKEKFDDKSLWALDQAIMRGIPTAFFIDIKNFIPGRFYIMPQDAGLHDLLKHYGAQVGDRLIFDAQCESIVVTQNVSGMTFQTNTRYPFIPLVDRILNTHPIGRGLEAVALPFTTSVEPVPGLPGSIHFTPLLYTTQRSFFAAIPQGSVAPPDIPKVKADDPHGPYSVGGLLEGTFPSYFQSKPVPVSGQTLIGTSSHTAIFVLGTSKVIDPRMAELTGTEALISNVLTFLSKDETLIGIRSKGSIIRPLKPLTTGAQQIVKACTLLLTTLLPVLLGLWIWRRRQSWRAEITSEFKS